MDSDIEERRGKLLWGIAFFANALIEVLSLGLSIWCGYTAYSVSKYMNAIENYDKGQLLKVMTIIGLVGWIIAVFATFLTYNSTTPLKAYRLRYILYSYFGWGSALIATYVISAAFVFVSRDFEQVFSPGFSVANYSNDSTIRKAIDDIQMDFSCCGNQKHTDWFGIPFSVHVTSRQVAIPESCCNSSRSCVRVVSVGERQKLTPYDKGCLKAISSNYSTIVLIRAALFAIIAAAEVVVLVILCVQVAKIKEYPSGEMQNLIINLEPKKFPTLPGKSLLKKKANSLTVISKESKLKGSEPRESKKPTESEKNGFSLLSRTASTSQLRTVGSKDSKSLASGMTSKATSRVTFGTISGLTSKMPSRAVTPLPAVALTPPDAT